MEWLVIALGVIILLIVIALIYKRVKKSAASKYSAPSTDKEEQFYRNCKSYNLSGRETEVTRLILLGWTYKAVAEHLFISEKTVDSHMQNIYTKTGVRNKLSLMNLLYR